MEEIFLCRWLTLVKYVLKGSLYVSAEFTWDYFTKEKIVVI